MFLLAMPRALAQEEAAPSAEQGQTTRTIAIGPDAAATDAGTESTSEAKAEAAERAKAEFARGNDAYEAGRYRVAAEAFERAHSYSPHSAVLFNAARAWWKMGELERAADDYAEAIRRGELTSDQTLRARATLTRLREKLGWVIVRGQEGTRVSIGYHQGVRLPVATHLTPGDHMLEVERDGERWTQIVTVEENSPLSVLAHPDKQKKDSPEPPPRPPPAPQKPSPGRKRQKAIGWTALSLGATAGVGAGVLGVLTLRSRDRFDELNDGTRENIHAAEAQRDEAYTLRLATNVLAFSGAALGVTGLALLVTLPRKGTRAGASSKGPRATLTVRPNQVALSGRF